uniref:beta-1,3-galactosyl-O-glycosyl-glycoprotein beta-1,6-N-acetylglucosaminyltransferase 3-like n=1 Tax=Styela clava TaxID=7725 RepID=UPI001939306D|nr:beta-1,3-galactosyl-O-glycosyl-glycoprotein beta-1,6-N-acetylglucosaminyltransferase 3-like [Styela clava]
MEIWKQKQLAIVLLCCVSIYVIMGNIKENLMPQYTTSQRYPYMLKDNSSLSEAKRTFIEKNDSKYVNNNTILKQTFTEEKESLTTTKAKMVNTTSTVITTTNTFTTTETTTLDTTTSIGIPRSPLLRNLDCKGIMDGNNEAVKKARREVALINSEQLEERKKKYLSDERVAEWTKNCSYFKSRRKYITQPLSEEEEKYPIAYIISVYKSLHSFENLLRLIYHPQNIYCIHIDQKSDPTFQKRVKEIADCFDNVFLASTMTKVYYTHWTIVQSSLNCLTDLIGMEKSHQWNYVFNLCGLDFPTKTNLEIVRALKNLNGTNSVASANFVDRENKLLRFKYEFKLPTKIVTGHEWLTATYVKKSPPPHGFQMFSGTDYFIWSRKAVEYFMNDSKIRDFFEWNKNTLVPDEHVWASIQRMYPQVPGSLPPTPDFRTTENDVITRTRVWGDAVYRCKSRYVRAICIFGVADLHWLVAQKGIFANKMDSQVDAVATECLSEWLRNRTLENTSLYKT